MKVKTLGKFFIAAAIALAGGTAIKQASASPLTAYKAVDLPVALQIWSVPASEPSATINMAVFKGYYSVYKLAHDVQTAFPEAHSSLVFGLGDHCYHISYTLHSELYVAKVCEVGNDLTDPKPSTGDSRYYTPKLPLI